MPNPISPTTPSVEEQWNRLAQHVDQGLAVGKVLRELFWFWENDHHLGTRYCMEGLTPQELRSVMDVLNGELSQASELVYDMEPPAGQGRAVTG